MSKMTEILKPSSALLAGKTIAYLTGLLALFLVCFSTLAFSDHGGIHELTNKALEEDSPSAQYKLGLLYLKGDHDGPADIKKAIEWLTLASEQGFAAASHRLAMLHYEGKHPTLTRQEARALLEQAASKGHAQAQKDLAAIIRNPPPLKKVAKITPKEPKAAVASTPTPATPVQAIDKTNTQLVSSLAQNGDANAQHILAGLLRTGDGVPKDSEAAVKWYEKAIEQGHADAMFDLGDMYSNGDGIKRNRIQAKRLYKKAAEKGHTRARLRLSGCKDC
jgi:hypothetical protein